MRYLALFLLIGCDTVEVAETTALDQCLRRELFFQCITSLPKGPERVDNSNDWDEVIEACGREAYRMSLRKASSVKEECSLNR